MDCDAFRTVLPAEFHRRFLINKVRADGRSFLTYRQPLISSNTLTNCCGSASVRAGNNYYLAGVKCEVGPPVAKGCTVGNIQPQKSACAELLESQRQLQAEASSSLAAGRIVASVEFPSICGADFSDGGGPNANAPLLISGVVTDLLNSNSVIDTCQLCLRTEGAERGEIDENDLRDDENSPHPSSEFGRTEANLEQTFAWHLHVHVVCLEYDGNPLDFALLAAVAALENTVLPAISWDAKAKWWRQLLPAENRPDFPGAASAEGLSVFNEEKVVVSNRPLSVTFSHVMNQWWVVDPSREEEKLGCGLSVVFLKNRWHVLRLGGPPVTASVVKLLQMQAEAIAAGADAALTEAAHGTHHCADGAAPQAV
ncbi:conserved hypothetical protein [Neospora caninum Liverpool]|uniref:Ribosomal RNA-processing protein 43 n=1 Tax=Neospora caninum (strain Liverpool) TaxID=572307 RepID=F0VD99_NEOCL|nr:conserved hypothetical protein [Neospora caninum Liverpool]CBZ51614.1 conserved hypothetical protein [Neospora caninum Liverpool]CEL65566.1 TPA: Exosome complex component RRP43 [Neospora caninum Liverpool]|eukprot:XP_003881647.1 conserved hypothetical protein [Neospora caninum Liverpool]